MRWLRVRAWSGMAVIACSLVFANASHGQGYPGRPVRLVVPFAPGGGTDMIARIMAPRIADSLGQQVVVDNRPGAAGIIGAEAVARAQPDGQTLLIALTGTLAINPSLYRKLPYEPLSSFAPISLLATSPNILVVHPSIPVRTVTQLIALAKARPGELNFASSGTGGAPHLAGELFNRLAGINIVHVPYKGAGPALTDVLGGHVSSMFSALPPVLPHVKSGKLRALAITAAKRSALAPGLPTMAEKGVPGFEVSSWFGMLAPAGTPKEIIDRLNKEAVGALASAEVKDKFALQGLEPMTSTPDGFSAFIRTEIARWGKIVRDSGISAN